METYVINLTRRQDRLQRVTGKFATLGVKLSPFEATDAQSVRFLESGLISRGLAANWLSHARLLSEISSGDSDYALIVEDDSEPSRHVDWPLLLASAAIELPRNNIDLLQLGFCSWQYKLSTRPGLFEAFRNLLYPSQRTVLSLDTPRTVITGSFLAGAHGYIVSRSFANSLSNFNNPPWTGSDGLLMRMSSMSSSDPKYPKIARLGRSIIEQESRRNWKSKIESDVTTTEQPPPI